MKRDFLKLMGGVAAAKVSAGGALGCTSMANTSAAQSGKTCSAHCRSACAKGAWAMIRIRVQGMVRTFKPHYPPDAR